METVKSNANYSILIFIGFEVVLGIICLLGPSMATTIASLLVFFIGFGVILAKNPDVIPRGITVLYAITANILGVAVIELQSLYLVELRCYTYFAGSTPTILLAWWTFFAVFCLASQKILAGNTASTRYIGNIHPSEKTKNALNWINVAIAIVYLIMLIHVFKHPAFLLGYDRFQYSVYLTGVWGKLNNIMTYTYPLICVCIIWSSKRIGIMSLVTALLYLAWTGNKFGPFFSILSIFLFAWYPLLISKLKSVKPIRLLACSVAAVSAIVLLAVGQFSLTNGFVNNEQSVTYFYQRAAQQGQLWWKTYDLCTNLHYSDSVEDELPIWFSGKDNSELNHDYGIYKIMWLTTPSDLCSAKIESGSRYTEAGHAAAYLYGGMFGVLIFSLIMGFAIATAVSALILSLANGWLIETLILFRLFQLLRTTLSMFTFNDLFAPVSLCSYAVLILLFLIRKRGETTNRLKGVVRN